MIVNPKFAAIALSWLLLGFIVYSTISPLDLRPRMGTFVTLERFGAFGVVGFLFAIAYQKHIRYVTILLLLVVTGLEVAQALSPDRHARLGDLAVKMAGTGCGIVAAQLLLRNKPWLQGLLTRVFQSSKSGR